MHTDKSPTYVSVRFGKHVEDMNLDEVCDAIDSLERGFAMAREVGEGISTKETVSHWELRERRAVLRGERKSEAEKWREIA